MKSPIAAVVIAAVLAAIYWFPIRRWFISWGTSAAERGRVMAGDSFIADPNYSATLAITIGARPEHIWPWLLQMGYRRGGLYSYDRLDQLFGFLDRPSADRILPEFQHLNVGDEIPLGRGPAFPVAAVSDGRSLVLAGRNGGLQWVWQFGLYPLDEARTRLESRNSARVPSSVGWWLVMRALEPAAFLMTRRMLIGIKRRAENLSAAQPSRG